MSLHIIEGRATICCQKCAKRVSVGEALVLTYADITAVTFVCQPCSVLLAKQWKDKGVDTRPALAFFKQLCGRAV